VRQPWEGRDGALVRIDNGVKGNGHSAEAFLFELLVLLGIGIRAVGIKIHQHEVFQ
jgi:hypothetical protein